MKYILTETEYQEIRASKKQAHEFLTLKEACKLDNKKLAEQAHELLVKEAEIADLSSKVRSLTKENQTYLAQIEEMKRDCEGTSRALRETQRVSSSRLKLVTQLMREKARHFRAEYVCIAQNPKTGITRVISAIVADTYRKFGWTVSEEFLVDRPA